MSCRLILMRHSHAASPAGVRDFDRPLTADGERLAETTGRLLRDLGEHPNTILASAARRTSDTAEIVCRQFPDPPVLERCQKLYQAPARQWLPVLQQRITHPDGCVLMVGHNPGVGMLMRRLAPERFPVPPATTAVFQMETESWDELDILAADTCELVHLIVNGVLQTDIGDD